MAQPDELILTDVRCFKGEQRGQLRPITLLVGENSTGKSTFLACFSILHQMFAPVEEMLAQSPDFNREPFLLGSFRDIVRRRRGREGRIDDFKIGIEFAHRNTAKQPISIEVTFAEDGSQPIERSCLYRFGPSDFLELRRSNTGGTVLSVPHMDVEVDFPFNFFHSRLDTLVNHKEFGDQFPDAKSVFSYVRQLVGTDHDRSLGTGLAVYGFRNPLRTQLNSVAPLRAKPKRTYDPVREVDSPEGVNVPMLMMRLDHAEKSRWRLLRQELVNFGKESGLFTDIKVRRHGTQISDPFQIQVKVQSSSHANIMNVGYGVSQSLPILVNLLAADEEEAPGRRYHGMDRTFLLQQPEVHLHPRGQAELAELFARAVKRRRDNFLIETHSDYIVDRMRILVRRKLLRPDDVSIIFFEPRRNAVKMHNITLDKFGNLKNAPPSYRSFFLKESDRLLGFDDGAPCQCA